MSKGGKERRNEGESERLTERKKRKEEERGEGVKSKMGGITALLFFRLRT